MQCRPGFELVRSSEMAAILGLCCNIHAMLMHGCLKASSGFVYLLLPGADMHIVR